MKAMQDGYECANGRKKLAMEGGEDLRTAKVEGAWK